MSEQTSSFDHESFLVSTAFVFGNREFEVVVEHDGFSYWFDPLAKNEALKSDPNLMAKAIFGSQPDRKLLAHVHDEWTVKAQVPEDALRVIRNELSPRYWADDFLGDLDFDTRLDALLEPIFWSDVNSQLSVPVTR